MRRRTWSSAVGVPVGRGHIRADAHNVLHVQVAFNGALARHVWPFYFGFAISECFALGKICHTSIWRGMSIANEIAAGAYDRHWL